MRIDIQKSVLADWTFGFPTVEEPWRTWRCKLDSSTTSKSTIPIRPTPAATKYINVGEPKPPVPTHNTLDALSFCWPSIPTSSKMRCREYRAIQHFPNVANQTSKPPAIEGTMVNLSSSSTSVFFFQGTNIFITQINIYKRNFPLLSRKCFVVGDAFESNLQTGAHSLSLNFNGTFLFCVGS